MNFKRSGCLLLLLSLSTISAFEARGATFVVNRLDDPPPVAAPNGCNSGGSCSLREAVLAANALGDPDVIELGPGAHDLKITEAGSAETGDLDITGSVTIRGLGPDQTTINGVQPDLASRIFEVTGSGAIVTIEGVTIQSGLESGGTGGGLFVATTSSLVRLSNCQLRQNRSSDGGGGIFTNSSTEIENCTIDDNTADTDGGGGIRTGGFSTLKITNSAITNNKVTAAVSAGGGLYFGSAGALEIEGSHIDGNKLPSGGIGAGILCSGGPILISRSSVSDNIISATPASGGGINCAPQNMVLDTVEVNRNILEQGGSGAGLLLGGSLEVISNSRIEGNKTLVAGGPGAGAQIFGGPLIITGSTISGNISEGAGSGGGLNLGTPNTVIEGSTFHDNHAADDGGGLFTSSPVSITNSTFSGNFAGNNGGGARTGPGQLNNVTFVGNRADADDDGSGRGGGLFNDSSMTPRNSIIALNLSGSEGGPDCSGNIIPSSGYNLFGDDEGCTITPPQGDPASVDLYGLDPKVGDLADNGGPTQTRALLSGSPAIDAGDPAGCLDANDAPLDVDQRGQVRPGGPRCDIGAFEVGNTDLSIAKSASASQVRVGEAFTYTLKVENAGPGLGFNLQVIDTLPAGVALTSLSSDKASCSESAGTVSCDLAQLAAGESFTVDIEVTADQEGAVENTATLAGAEGDSNPDNNQSSVTVTVVGGGSAPDIGGGGCQLSQNGGSFSWVGFVLAAMGGLALIRLRWEQKQA